MTADLGRPELTGDVWAKRIAVGKRIVERYPATRISFLSGSFLDGFATPTSDLDIFVLVDDGADVASAGSASFDAGGRRIDIDYADDVTIDTEVWPVGSVAAIATELEKIDLENWNAAGAIESIKLTVAHRLRIGEPLTGLDEFAALRDTFDWARLATVIRNRCLALYNSLADDAIGAIKSGDGMTAVLMSRDALGAAADALTAAYGHTNAKSKWRWRKFDVLGISEHAAAYRRAESLAGETDAEMLAGSKARLRLASEFAVKASARR
ncbi:nucleotidyltransferase domain-containing protein [Lentzea sp. HUAS TT2]|uniref:nucleotidyltransferase domain-containing protein n=1 Tax=Lentzea sp. HUAS TT2 TaxID=3447454 RepID=UPI003F70561A